MSDMHVFFLPWALLQKIFFKHPGMMNDDAFCLFSSGMLHQMGIMPPRWLKNSDSTHLPKFSPPCPPRVSTRPRPQVSMPPAQKKPKVALKAPQPGNADAMEVDGQALGGPEVEDPWAKLTMDLIPMDFGALGPMPPIPPLGSDAKIWEKFYALMVEWVRGAIPIALKNCGITVPAVEEALPTRIQDNMTTTGRNALTTFRGDWDVQSCLQAMESTSLYESCGSAHWLNSKTGTVEFLGQVVLEEHTPWSQVQAALHCWSWDQYLTSSEKPMMRRLIFPVTVPTACESTEDAKQSVWINSKGPGGKDVIQERPIFKDCPVLAGRAHLLAMYLTMAECMMKWGEQNRKHFLKLWEALLSNFFPYILSLVHFLLTPPCPSGWMFMLG